MSQVYDATDTNFETDVLRSSELTLVDFWGEWCTSCKPLAKTIESLAPEFAGRVKMVKMNVENSPQTATRYHVRGLPVVLFFKGGEVVDQFAGNQPRDLIVETIKKHLG